MFDFFSGDIVRGYDFIVNAVFPEIVTDLEMRVSSIFAPGNPDAFHRVSLKNKQSSLIDFTVFYNAEIMFHIDSVYAS